VPILQQKIPNAGSSLGPALAVFNDTLCAAWKGVFGDPRIYTATISFSTGYDWQAMPAWTAQTEIPGVATDWGPSLAVFNGSLYAAWKGVGGDPGIYWSVSVDGQLWVEQVQIPGVGTSFGPSLVTFQDSLYAAWKGEGASDGIFWSSFNGDRWTGQQQMPGAGTSVGPSLAVDPQTGDLYAAWRGAGGDSNIYWALLFDPPAANDWSDPQPVPGAGTSFGPSLAVFQDLLYGAWRSGTDDHVFWASFTGTTFEWSSSGVVVPGIGTSFRPALAAYAGSLFAAWKGVDDDTGIYWGPMLDLQAPPAGGGDDGGAWWEGGEPPPANDGPPIYGGGGSPIPGGGGSGP
jgi:hypothetical protein